jgi:hypothetical protein
MDKDTIIELLENKHNSLINLLNEQDDKLWDKGPEGKWTSGQQALHLLQSIKPLNFALSLPKFILKYKYGKANRDLRDYDSIVKRYHERLENTKGITFKGSQNMEIPTLKVKASILNKLNVESKKLQKATKKISNKNLDTLILPHPLMGKMPIREIIMWTAYHVEHHTNTLKTKY